MVALDDRAAEGVLAVEGGAGRVDGVRHGVVVEGDVGLLGPDQDEAVREVGLGELVGRAERDVDDAQAVAGAVLEDDRGAELRDEVPAVLRVDGGAAHDAVGGDVLAVGADGEPEVLVHVLVRQRQGEGELGVRGGRVAVNHLGEVEVASAGVGRGQRLGALGLGVDLALDPVVVPVAVDVVVAVAHAGGDVGAVGLGEHGLDAVDEHRVEGLHVEVPVEGDLARLLQLVVVALVEDLDRPVLVDPHQADGDVHGALEAVVGVERDRVGLPVVVGDERAVPQDVHRDRLLLLALVAADPDLLEVHLLGVGGDPLELVRERLRVLGRVLLAGVRPGQRGAGVGLQRVGAVALVDEVLPDRRVQAVVRDRAVLQVGDHVVGLLAGVDVEGDGVGDAVEQRAHGAEVPVHRGAGEARRRRVEGVEVVGPGPPVPELAAGDGGLLDGDGLGRAAAVCPGDGRAADGVGDGVAVAVDARELVVHHGDGEPVLVGALVDLEQVDGAGRGLDAAGGAVGDGGFRDAERLDDLLEDVLDGLVEGLGAAGVEVVVGGGRAAVVVGPVRAGVGVVDQVVEEVGLGAVGVDAEEGGVRARLDGAGRATGGLVVRHEAGPGLAGRVDGVVAVAGGGAGTVGDQDDEGRVVVGRVVEIGLGLLQRGLPVGAVVLAVVVGAGDLPVDAVVEEAVDATAPAAEVARPALTGVRTRAEAGQRDLDVGAVAALVPLQAFDEVVHDVLGVVRAVAVGVGGDVVARHGRRLVVHDDDVHVRRRLDVRVRVAGDAQLQLVGAVAVVVAHLVVLGRFAHARQRDVRPEHDDGERRQRGCQPCPDCPLYLHHQLLTTPQPSIQGCA